MHKRELVSALEANVLQSQRNFIQAEEALDPKYVGMQIFELPIVGVAAADDPIFGQLQNPEAIGEHFLPPREWLPEARSVVSFFIPYTKAIRQANARDFSWPAEEWLHGRYEGQMVVAEQIGFLLDLLTAAGHEAVAPVREPRFAVGAGENRFTSNWSERHIAYACGLGTFGISKGIITAKGTCGRLGSVVTSLELSPDQRPYSDPFAYCSKCGICVPHCPAGAISLEAEKDSSRCSAFLDQVRQKHPPRYGCGKCQVAVPCESGIPALQAR